MVEIIAGEKGKGKTKILIKKVNDAVKLTTGNIVFLDKNNKHMYELSNRIRLINIPDYNISSADMFAGFLLGIISQDHDLDQIYLDSYLTIANVSDSGLSNAIDVLNSISEKYELDIVISMSKNKEDLPEDVQKYVTVAL